MYSIFVVGWLCSYLYCIQREPSASEIDEYTRLLRAILKDNSITREESEAMVSWFVCSDCGLYV